MSKGKLIQCAKKLLGRNSVTFPLLPSLPLSRPSVRRRVLVHPVGRTEGVGDRGEGNERRSVPRSQTVRCDISIDEEDALLAPHTATHSLVEWGNIIK